MSSIEKDGKEKSVQRKDMKERAVFEMIYENDVVRDVQIAYIGGGSRGWARTFMTDLAMEPRMGGTIRLYDIDTEAAKANETIGNHLSRRKEAVGKWA